jgi:3-oxoacyl-[acyl-carrier-protein] synthase II
MKRRRVKITGIGPVTPAGIGREAFWKGILEPISRVSPYKKIGDDFGPFVAAHIDPFEIGKYIERTRLPKVVARHTMFAVAGAVLAVQDAGISIDELCSMRSAVITGSSIMDFGGIISSSDAVRDKGARAAQSRVLYSIGIGSVPSVVSQTLGISARTFALSNQCNSGLDAIGYAASLVASGEIDIALCGGTEAPLQRFPLVELRAADLTPSTTDLFGRQARPFDLWRTTGVVGEGCSMFLIEPESSPRAGYSYIAGYGFANDEANQLCEGMAAAGRLAVAQARMHLAKIDVINAWGPGHKLVDRGEARAMDKLFGPELKHIAAVSIKGAIGTPLGAAPAIQVASALLGQRFGIIPPTVNWEYADPVCPFNLSNRARSLPHDVTLVNSHGFGGVNSSIVLERC